MTRLGTFVEVDAIAADRQHMSLSARHEAVCSTACRESETGVEGTGLHLPTVGTPWVKQGRSQHHAAR